MSGVHREVAPDIRLAAGGMDEKDVRDGSMSVYRGIANGLEAAGLAGAVMEELRKGVEFERVQARLNQERVAREQTQRRFVDGVGECEMEVDATVYHYWGQRLGYGCWRDKKFRREFRRDNPEVRVSCRSGKTRIVVPGLEDGRDGKNGRDGGVEVTEGLPVGVRYRKVYEMAGERGKK